MKDEDSSGKPEIVIVRRRGAEDSSAGKAGAWKIAYADFVTAMMAFFLVMWLINASNEETLAQVASYFNPIKLTDTSTGERSLKDMKEAEGSEGNSRQAAEESGPSKKDMEMERRLLADPPEALNRIADAISELQIQASGLESRMEIAPARNPDDSNPGVGDPFDPQAWEKLSSIPGGENVETIEPKSLNASLSDLKQPDNGKMSSSNEADLRESDGALKIKDKSDANDRTNGPQMAMEANLIAQEIRSRLTKKEEVLKEAFSVTPTASGILVSLTEAENFEMFKTGSAEPKPETLRLVEVIANVIKSRKGDLIIRGHTDSRPFRNRYHDNWQLSTARAHFARYMLLQGGLDEGRIRRIEGVADREPRNASDPRAAENRRIEILISSGKE